MADEDAASGELLTFDLNEWPPDMLHALELMLRGRSIAFEWNPPGVLNVSTWHEHEVDEFLDYLEADPGAAPASSRGPTERGPMSLDDFYNGDSRRRASEEVDLGRDWTDTEQVVHDLCWVRETGELTLMRATGRPTIEVLTRVPTLESVEVLLGAWAEVMAQPNSVGLLRERVAGARVQPTVPKPPIEDAPRGSTAVDELWIVPAPVGWITGEMDLIFAAYRELRDRLDPDQSLKHALVTALDRDSWQRLTEFFDGDKDVVYGEGAGEQARIAIRDALEHRLAPATGS